jgi:hypothetical protein
MTNRELSEKLSNIADRLGEVVFSSKISSQITIEEIIRELRKLSNENYSPHTLWSEVKKQAQKPPSKKPWSPF